MPLALGRRHDHSEAKRLLGAKPRKSRFPKAGFDASSKHLTLPAANVSSLWSGCVGDIRDQGNCGSCYAFAATETLSDRYCVSFGAKLVLSSQWVTDCDQTNDGCDGGDQSDTWEFMEKSGVPTDVCDPYISGPTGDTGTCSATCTARYSATNILSYDTPEAIQTVLMYGGSVQVYQGFFSYTSGIYSQQSGVFMGYHSVKIVGWGSLNGVNYWNVANSWGTCWGNQGFFFIEFGQCGIDSDGIAGSPVL